MPGGKRSVGARSRRSHPCMMFFSDSNSLMAANKEKVTGSAAAVINESMKQPESTPENALDKIEFGREVCGVLEIGEEREWLVTNGIGGFASGTVSGSSTRRYHGLLVAALKPPVGRTQLVAKLDETAHYAEKAYARGTSRWTSGAAEPKGYLNLES